MIKKKIEVEVEINDQDFFNAIAVAGPLTKISWLNRLVDPDAITDDEIADVREYVHSLDGLKNRLIEFAKRCELTTDEPLATTVIRQQI